MRPFRDQYINIIQLCFSLWCHCSTTWGSLYDSQKHSVLYITVIWTSVPPDGFFVVSSLRLLSTVLFLPKPFTFHPCLTSLSPLTCVSSISSCPSLSGTFELRHRTEMIVCGSLKSCIVTLTPQVYRYVGLLKEES